MVNIIIKEKGYNLYHRVQMEVTTSKRGNKIARILSDAPCGRKDWMNAEKRYSIRWNVKDEYINELGNKGLFDVLEGRQGF